MTISLDAIRAAERRELGIQGSPRAQTVFERWAFAFFLFALPFQTRIFLKELAPGFPAGGEWMSAWIWLSDIAFLVLLFSWMRQGIRKEDFKPLLFLFAFVPAFVVHPTPLAGWTILKLAEGLLVFAYVRRHREWFLTTMLWPAAFLVGLAFNTLIAIAQFAVQHDLGLQVIDESPLDPEKPGVAKIIVAGAKVLRAYGVTPHPNILAALLLSGIATVAFLYIFRGVRRANPYSGKRQREEFVRGLLLFVIVFALIFTFSRTAWLGAVIFFFAVIATILFRSSLRGPYAWEAVRFTILFTVVAAMATAAFWPYVTARSELPLATEAVALRTFTAQEAVGMIADHPVTGVGPGQFVPALLERNPGLASWEAQPVHNAALLLAAENGLPAMFALVIAFLFLVLATWRRILTMHDPMLQLASLCLLSFVTGIIVFSLGDHFLLTSQQGRLLLWLTLGLLAP